MGDLIFDYYPGGFQSRHNADDAVIEAEKAS